MTFAWTLETRAKLNKLRHEKHLTLKKCASIIGCSESCVYKALSPPKPKPPLQSKPKPAPKKSLLPPHQLNKTLHNASPDRSRRQTRPATYPSSTSI
jgi:hypothetical protein